MKDPKKRLRQTILLALIFLIVYSFILLFIEQRQYNDLIMKDSAYKTETVRSMIEGYKKTAAEVGRGFWQEQNAEVKLMTIRREEQVVNGEYTGKRYSDKGMVVCVRNGQVELPPEAEGMFTALTPEMITNEYTQMRTSLNTGTKAGRSIRKAVGSDEVILISGRIAGDWYYIEWVSDEVYREYIMSHLSEEELLQAQESDNDTELIVVKTMAQPVNAAMSAEIAAADPEETGAADSAISESAIEGITIDAALMDIVSLADTDVKEGTFLYKTKGMARYNSLDDLGITQEDLKEDSFTIETDSGKKYVCIPIGMEILGHTFISCNSVEDMNAAFIGDTITQILLAAAMLTGLVTWCFSVQWLVGGETADEKQKNRYTPEAVKKRTTRLTIMSTAVVTFFAFLTVMMQCMYQENRIGINVLSLLQIQVEDAVKNDDNTSVPETERYERLGEIVSAMLTENQALMEREKLSEIADAIDAEYIIVFDGNGTETACSRAYTGLALPADPEDSASDFRRLLNGIPAVTHETERDFITGQTRAVVGICYEYPGGKKGMERYGAVLIALPSPDASLVEGKEDIVQKAKDQIYGSIQTEDRMIIEVDPETHRILSCSKDYYTGSELDGLGINPAKLRDRLMGFYHFEEEWYFGVTKAAEDALYIYMTDSTGMSRAGIIFSLLAGALFLISYLLTAQFALKDYTDEYYERYASEIAESADKYVSKIEKKAPSAGSFAAKWRSMLPEEKTKVVLQLETGVLMAILIVIALGNSPLSRHSALSFAMKGNWSKGFNLFSVIAVTVVCCVGYLIFLILKLIFSILFHLADFAGDTVLGLVQSLTNYVIIIGTFCMSLSYLGIDTTTILASLGIFSLAISLGAKDMVTDIIAGLSIILEKTYTVGDFIQVGDFKGKVLNIGVRSTKIVNGTHDVKIISNHEISNVINYSRQTTVCPVRISVPVTTSVSGLRELFERELPKVREINPHIISGPKFDGITGFEDDRMIISFSVEGPEEFIYGIKLDLNQALQSMAERHLLQYANTSITVNMADGPAGTIREEPHKGTGEPEK